MATVTVMVSDCGQYCAAEEWWRLGSEPRHASCPHDNLHLTGKNDLEGLREMGGARPGVLGDGGRGVEETVSRG